MSEYVLTGYERFTYDFPNGDYFVYEYLFENAINIIDSEIKGETLIIPDQINGTDIVYIDTAAFIGCKINDIKFPEHLRYIGDKAFENCENLVSVEIPPSVDEVDTAAFRDCKNLRNIKFPNNITFIGDETLAGCSNLRTVVLPASVRLGKIFGYEGDYRKHQNSNITVICPADSQTEQIVSEWPIKVKNSLFSNMERFLSSDENSVNFKLAEDGLSEKGDELSL